MLKFTKPFNKEYGLDIDMIIEEAEKKLRNYNFDQSKGELVKVLVWLNANPENINVKEINSKTYIIIDVKKIINSESYKQELEKLEKREKDGIKMREILKEANGDCSDPTYPGSRSEDKDKELLNNIIEKLQTFISNKTLSNNKIVEKIESITFFIGNKSRDVGSSGIWLYANLPVSSEGDDDKIIFYSHKFIPLDISFDSYPGEKHMLQFLNKLKKIKEANTDITFKIINSICNTCFPIFDYLKNILGFEYKRTTLYDQGYLSSSKYKEGMGLCNSSIYDQRYFPNVPSKLKKIDDAIDDADGESKN